ncbi:MAG TPA: TonB-dependent receptor [Drouetiella sp.]
MITNWWLRRSLQLLLVASVCGTTPVMAQDASDPITLGNTASRNLKSRLLNSTAGSSFLAQSVNTDTAKPASAQKPGAISGKITDLEKTHGVKDARVVLSRVGEEHKRYHTETKPDGTYSVADVEPGDYHVTVSAADFLSAHQQVVIASGEAKVLDIAMEDLDPVETLRITGKRTLIHPESIGATTNIDKRTIYQYKSGNDLRSLIESTPGVMNDSYGNVITRGEHNAINYELDGVVIPEAAGVLQQTQPVSPRSLQSMKVDIGGYEASDGGGPLGAIARMKSLPIDAKPNFYIGQQIGGPIAGNISYNASGAFSQNPDDKLYNLRYSSSGQFRGTSIRIAPGTKDFVGNAGADINSLSQLVYKPNNKDQFKLDVSINETFIQSPVSGYSRSFGVHSFQQDRQDYFILSYKRKGEKLFDEANIHLLNGFYSESFKSSPAFDPAPVLNADQPNQSMAATARRFNYVFSAQGDVNKTVKKTHHFKIGFLDEVRPVRTKFGATYFNADLTSALSARGDALSQQQSLISAGDFAGASAVNTNPNPFGGVISPFTGDASGAQFKGSTYKGFRWLQSAYLQDKWTPKTGVLKRLTLDGGVRFDMQHSVFGNTQALAEQVAETPGVQPFDPKPYNTQRLTDAQASGRFGASFVLTKTTVARASFSNIFTPTPVDYFVIPFQVTGVNPVNGIYPGTPRPLRATRGKLVDFSIEQQIGPRFVTRTNLFYKELSNFGDSGVVGNLPIYNRLTNSGQEAYGVESRIDMKPSRDGYGFNGFASSTVQAAYLRGTHDVSGGFYSFSDAPPLPQYPDHDRRFQGTVGLGYKTRSNFWTLLDTQVLTGLQDNRDPAIYGPHPSRTPVICEVGLSAGYNTPLKIRKQYKWMPTNIDVRIENMLNQRYPTNLGSPFQGTRYMLPFRFLIGCGWQFGHEQSQVAEKPTAKTASAQI